MSSDTSLIGPSHDCASGELAAILTDDQPRLPVFLNEQVQLPPCTDVGERRIRHQGQALECSVIDGEDTEAAAVNRLIRHEGE